MTSYIHPRPVQPELEVLWRDKYKLPSPIDRNIDYVGIVAEIARVIGWMVSVHGRELSTSWYDEAT